MSEALVLNAEMHLQPWQLLEIWLPWGTPSFMGHFADQDQSIRLRASAVAILGLAFIAGLFLGFSLGQAASNLAEMIMAIALIVAAVMLFGPLGRSRRWLAAMLACVSVVIFWGINARLSIWLDVENGGDFAWSGARFAVLAVLVGPIIGLVAAAITFGFAHQNALNRSPKDR